MELADLVHEQLLADKQRAVHEVAFLGGVVGLNKDLIDLARSVSVDGDGSVIARGNDTLLVNEGYVRVVL